MAFTLQASLIGGTDVSSLIGETNGVKVLSKDEVIQGTCIRILSMKFQITKPVKTVC